MITKKKVLEAYKRKDGLKKRLRQLEDQFEKLYAEIENLNDLLGFVDCITEIYKGSPISVRTHYDYQRNICGSSVCAIPNHSREARIYLNAHTREHWGLQLYQQDKYLARREIFCGAAWPNMKATIQMAKDWVVSGKIPKRSGLFGKVARA